jgi:hypothetical protein
VAETPTLVLPIPANLRFDAVEEHLRQLDQLTRANPHEPVELDWKHIARVDPDAGAIFGAALLGSFANRRFLITLPKDPSRLDDLSRVGLTFAIANRARGLTALRGASQDDLGLTFWSRSWSRTADVTPPQLQLFAPEAIDEEAVDVEGTRHAAFVNPHLAQPVAGARTPAATVTRPWLTRLLPSWRQQPAALIKTFLDDANTIVSELVENVREHALVRPDTREPTASLLKLALSSHRLYITVQDNGPGIAQTARPKVEAVAGTYASKRDSEIVADLIDGLVPGWGRARATGLPKVARATAAHGGTLRVFSRRVRLTTANGLTPQDAEFDLLGSVLIATLQLPGSAAS